MKKIFGFLFAIMLFVSPIILRAEETLEKIDLSKYEKLGLKEVLAQESIEEEFTDYEESSEKINIYLFRGNGCGYCRAFLTFLDSITDEYGKYFNLVSFEVWGNANNSELLATVSKFMGQEAGGVPYIVIGDQVFAGYVNSYDDSIKSAITTLYDSKKRYDVFEEYNEEINARLREQRAEKLYPILYNLLFVAAGSTCVIIYISKAKKEILEKIEEKHHIIDTKKVEKTIEKVKSKFEHSPKKEDKK